MMTIDRSFVHFGSCTDVAKYHKTFFFNVGNETDKIEAYWYVRWES